MSVGISFVRWVVRFRVGVVWCSEFRYYGGWFVVLGFGGLVEELGSVCSIIVYFGVFGYLVVVFFTEL